MEQEFDSGHYKKVMQIECFPGIFKDSEGNIYDFRPAEGRPSLSNFKKMEFGALQKLLLKAFINQRKALEDVLAGRTTRPYDRASEEQFIGVLSARISKLERLCE